MSQSRQPKGVPIGGQYAANSHDEARASLLPSRGADTIQNGDSMVLPAPHPIGQILGSSVFRDFDGSLSATVDIYAPLNVEQSRWRQKNPYSYDDFVESRYGARVGAGNRISIESDMDTVSLDTSRIIENDDRVRSLVNDIDSREFFSALDDLIEKDTVVAEGRRFSVEDATAEAHDYCQGAVSEIDPLAARTLAAEVTRGGGLTRIPELRDFAQSGLGSKATMFRELQREPMPTTPSGIERRTALEGFLLA